MQTPSKLDLEKASVRIRPYCVRTPILSNTYLDEILGAEVFFKCEHLQHIGAFKMRGAANYALQALKQNPDLNGFVTHSSGNHAQAVARIAKVLGFPAHIVMPNNSNKVKIAGVKALGAELHLCEPTIESRAETARQVQEQHGLEFIPPYDHPWIVAGQATAAMELLADVGPLDILLAPVGGGGLIAGTALANHYWNSGITLASEPCGADDAYRSFQTGERVTTIKADTVCDGLRTTVGVMNFEVVQKHVSDILVVNDEDTVAAMYAFWHHTKHIIEVSSATVLAAMQNHKHLFKGKKVGAVLTGGNVDFGALPAI